MCFGALKRTVLLGGTFEHQQHMFWFRNKKTIFQFLDALIFFSRADPGFLERGFICIKVWVFALLILLNLT